MTGDPYSILLVSGDQELAALAREIDEELYVDEISVSECLDLRDELENSLIILDVTQKAESPFMLLRTLRSEGLDVPVVGLVSKGSVEDAMAYFRLGADEVIRKPVRRSVLETVLKRLLPGALAA